VGLSHRDRGRDTSGVVGGRRGARKRRLFATLNERCRHPLVIPTLSQLPIYAHCHQPVHSE
jgi:hypothetical protein